MNKLHLILYTLFTCLSVEFLEASIVYYDINPDSTKTFVGTTSGHGVCINFNGDTATDCCFRWDVTSVLSIDLVFLHITNDVNPSPSAVNHKPSSFVVNGSTAPDVLYVKPLSSGDTIGSNSDWSSGISGVNEPWLSVKSTNSTNNGNFVGLGDRYLGVEFSIGSNTHYGWILVNYDTSTSKVLTVKSYAYENTPNQQIMAGDKGAGVSLRETAKENYILYPNPVKEGTLFLEGDSPMSIYELYNASGQLVLRKEIEHRNNRVTQIETKFLNSGVYYLSVYESFGSKVSFRKKFLVE